MLCLSLLSNPKAYAIGLEYSRIFNAKWFMINERAVEIIQELSLASRGLKFN